MILEEDDSITLFSKVKPSLQSNIQTEAIKLKDGEQSYWDSFLDQMSDFDLDGFKEYLTDLEKESDEIRNQTYEKFMGFYDEVKVWVKDEVDQAEKSYNEIEESLSELIKD